MPLPHDVKVTQRTVDELRALLAVLERETEGVRVTLGLMNGSATAAARARQPGVLAAALDLDAARRGHRRIPRKYQKRKTGRPPAAVAAAPSSRRGRGSKVRAQRAASARLLAQFDPVEPRRLKGRGIGSFVRRGYLKAKGDGYVTTGKAYVVDLRKAAAAE
jgi:hypothetical protein